MLKAALRPASYTLIVAFSLTSSAPAYALRQTGAEESATQKKLVTALLTEPGTPEFSPSSVQPFPKPAPLAVLMAASGVEESKSLDDLLKGVNTAEKEERLSAIGRLGNYFSDILVERFPILSFGDGRRVLPDLTPVTVNGALGAVLGGTVGSGDKKQVDGAAAAAMRPTAEQALRIAGWNWWNRLGEGARDNIPLDLQIPPMEKPVIFRLGWPTAETANDPVDGTTRTSKGQDGGVSIFMVAPSIGLPIPDEMRIEYVVYTGRKASISLKRDSYETIFDKIAAANRRLPKEYEFWPLHRPHHQAIVQAARDAGLLQEKIRSYGDGSVQPALYMAAFPKRHIILGGRVGATEAKLIAAPLRNVRYPDGGKVHMRARIISENSGFEVEQKTDDDGTVYYEPKLDQNKKPVPSSNLANGTKLSLRDIRVLREAGYTEEMIEQIKDGSLEFDIEDMAPSAGDIFVSYITEPMTDLKGEQLYDWKTPVHGVQKAGGKVTADTLEFTAEGARITRHTYPDRGLGGITAQLGDQYRVVTTLRKLAVDADPEISAAARKALQDFLPHALMADLQRQAAQGMAGVSAGVEENSAPVIGWLQTLTGKEAALSDSLVAGNSSAKGQATRILNQSLGSVQTFDAAFGRLLALSRGNMEIFASTFERSVSRQAASVRGNVLARVRRLAQDPGAPHNKPPVSYFNPARYVYARLEKQELKRFVSSELSPVLKGILAEAQDRDLDDLQQKTEIVKALQERFGKDRQVKGPFQYEIFYDSLVEKEGEYYLTLELLLDGEETYRDGVVLELQVVLSPSHLPFLYNGPYPLLGGSVAVPQDAAAYSYRVGLLDPIHFINTRFPEWGPKTQRAIYESRLQALKDSGEKNKRQFIRPSVRQGNNPRFFEPFFRAYLEDDVPLAYHIVDALASERDYGNQGGVGSIGNLASAIVRRGGTGATASWLLENPEAAGEVARQGLKLAYTYEKDHHRMEGLANFASELEPFLLAYFENLITGWPSANLQDETKFIDQTARGAMLKAKASAAETGVIDEAGFKLLEATYNGQPVTAGLPTALQLNWLRNNWLRHVIKVLRAQGAPVAPFNRWYIEPDYALDAKPHTVEEMAYLTFESWIGAQAHGYPLGPVVPSYGNVHGAHAGNPSLALAGIHQYVAQAAVLYGEPLPVALLAIARKAPRGSLALAEQVAAQFKDKQLAGDFIAGVGLAGERTEADEERLRDFVLAQLQRIPADLLKILKQAEQVLLTEVALAQKEKRAPRQLGEISPGLERDLRRATARLDQEINPLPLDRRAAITMHAASSLSGEQLSQGREYGVWVANKSTEFQNIILKTLHIFYLLHTNAAAAQTELEHLPAAAIYLAANPPSAEQVRQAAELYEELYRSAGARALKNAKTDDQKEAVQVILGDPLLPFPWFWRDQQGWSMTDWNGVSWKDTKLKGDDWPTGGHGRYFFSMRDTMTGQGTDGTLLAPNALAWGLPAPVIAASQAEIERTIRFYHRPEIMKAAGGAAEYRAYMAAKETAVSAGTEEGAAKVAAEQLDSRVLQTRLAALKTLRQLERQGVKLPLVGPALPSYVHVHTTASYPNMPGVFSPARMVWAAHEAGADRLWLVDHETVAHIGEGFEAARIVNEEAEKPLRVIFGVEFKAPVAPERTNFLESLQRGVAAAKAAWVVGWGVPVGPNGEVPEGLRQLVTRFQTGKRVRAQLQLDALKNQGIVLELEDLVEPGERNITDRQLAWTAAREELGAGADPAELKRTADEIRRQVLAPFPLTVSPQGIRPYEETVSRVRELGMVPTFTMQVPTPELEPLVPELEQIGLEAFDLAGIEFQHPNALADVEKVLALARSKRLLIVGGADYRGKNAVGWPQKEDWMSSSAIQTGHLTVEALAAAGNDPVLAALVRKSAGLLAGSERFVRVDGNKATVYPHLITPLVFLEWLAAGRSADPDQLRSRVISEKIREAAALAGQGQQDLQVTNQFEAAKMKVTFEIQDRVPQFAPPASPDPARLNSDYYSAGTEEDFDGKLRAYYGQISGLSNPQLRARAAAVIQAVREGRPAPNKLANPLLLAEAQLLLGSPSTFLSTAKRSTLLSFLVDVWHAQNTPAQTSPASAGTEETIALIRRQQLTAVIPATTIEETVKVGETAWKHGIIPEITFRGPREVTLEAIRVLASEGIPVSAGTVLTVEDALDAVLAGAGSIISPAFLPEVVRAAKEAGAVMIPTVRTPQEAKEAVEAGADFLKVFPVLGGDNDFEPQVVTPIPAQWREERYRQMIRLIPSSDDRWSSLEQAGFTGIYLHLRDGQGLKEFAIPTLQRYELLDRIAEAAPGVGLIPTGHGGVSYIPDLLNHPAVVATGMLVTGPEEKVEETAFRMAAARQRAIQPAEPEALPRSFGYNIPDLLDPAPDLVDAGTEETVAAARGAAFTGLLALQQEFQQQPPLRFDRTAPSRTGVLVDLSGGVDQALAALQLPPEIPVLVNANALAQALQIDTTRSLEGRQLFVTDGKNYAVQLHRAINAFRDVDSIRILSTRPAAEVRAAQAGDTNIPVTVEGDQSVESIFQNLGAVFTQALRDFLQRLDRSVDYSRFL